MKKYSSEAAENTNRLTLPVHAGWATGQNHQGSVVIEHAPSSMRPGYGMLAACYLAISLIWSAVMATE
jgi:hypothetical protein